MRDRTKITIDEKEMGEGKRRDKKMVVDGEQEEREQHGGGIVLWISISAFGHAFSFLVDGTCSGHHDTQHFWTFMGIGYAGHTLYATLHLPFDHRMSIQNLTVQKTKKAPKVEVGTGISEANEDEWLEGTAYARFLSSKKERKKKKYR